jgi:hypothetical protein
MIGLLILSALFAGAVELVCFNWRELSWHRGVQARDR